MPNHFKKIERKAFAIFITLTFIAAAIGITLLILGKPAASKWLATSGLLSTITGVIQLEIGGLFERLTQHYGNDEQYPFGPSSHVTREIIDNPDRPFRTWVRNVSFFNLKTGFWLIIVGTLVQVLAVWV
ncbi:hypothetical protein [Cellvibrio fontiphilus]|uniref:Integron gene cassette protein n=1 Tax=Cellvibrio fontiphilus TaxID=1815559 RepID=A0ABV7FLB0_9GAMM